MENLQIFYSYNSVALLSIDNMENIEINEETCFFSC